MQNTSGLPPNLEAKRLLIARAYNQFMVLNLGIVVVLLVAVLVLVKWLGHRAIYGLGLVLPAEAAMIHLGIRRGDDLCRKVDFMCPHCQRPLFEARSSAYLSGSCPKCNACLTPNQDTVLER